MRNILNSIWSSALCGNSILNKNLGVVICIVFLQINTAFSQEFFAGPNGVWIKFGSGFPKDFKYVVLRKDASDIWKEISIVNLPLNKEEIRARMFELNKQNISFTEELSEKQIDFLNRQIRLNKTDSLIGYMRNLPALYCIGLAGLDENAKRNSTYSYKVQQVNDAGDVLSEKVFENISTEPKKINTKFELYKKHSDGKNITIEYIVKNYQEIYDAIVYRGFYMRSEPEKTFIKANFLLRGDTTFCSITDYSATPKVAFTYYLQGIDIAGNLSNKSDVVNIYNHAKNSLPPSVHFFRTKSVENDNAIKLSWRLNNTSDVVSIDIYKAHEYDGRYLKIASVNANDTFFYDEQVKPVHTYYYSILLNGYFESSVPSARVPGMLKANKSNEFPVNNFEVDVNNNIVKLSWTKNENDTRAYNIYRSRGWNAEPKLIKAPIVSDVQELVAFDTVSQESDNVLYIYTIADLNTSYNQGPLSTPKPAVIPGFNRLPIISEITAKKMDNKIMLIFANPMNRNVGGFCVFRKKILEDASEKSWEKIAVLDNNENIFEDSGFANNIKYIYTIKCFGINENDLGDPSPEITYLKNTETILNVSNIQLFNTSNGVQILWQNPLTSNLKNIIIKRALKGGNAEIIATLNNTEINFIDKTVSKNNTYYYYIYTTANSGKTSSEEGPIGVFAE